ncbi:MAG: aldo/keto reductase [Firmicutes bacterium]|nr:aldo/keto reductase [Bacillota bacterium]
MEYRKSGKFDLKLGVLGLGCWAFGGGHYWGEQAQKDVNEVVRAAVDLGVNYFDTAEAYNDGKSEESLGQALKGVPRDKVIIGTKISPSNTSPDSLVRHCEQSLKRLGTDYIDLYMVHWPITRKAIAHFTDEEIEVPAVDEAFAALRKLKEQGKIRFVGVSNFAANKLEEALDTGTEIAINQLPYNLLCRAIEYDILPHCAEKGIGVIGYMVLLQGILADIYPTLDDVPTWQRRTRHFDARKCKEVRHGEFGAEEETNAALAEIREIARDCGLSMPEIAVKWAMANPAITCVLAGSRNVKELEANVKAVEKPLPLEVVEKLNKVTDHLKEKLGPSFDYYETAANDRTK